MDRYSSVTGDEPNQLPEFPPPSSIADGDVVLTLAFAMSCFFFAGVAVAARFRARLAGWRLEVENSYLVVDLRVRPRRQSSTQSKETIFTFGCSNAALTASLNQSPRRFKYRKRNIVPRGVLLFHCSSEHTRCVVRGPTLDMSSPPAFVTQR